MKITSLFWLSALAVILYAKMADPASSDLVEGGEIDLSYRLPNETYPEHYYIKLTTNVHTGEKSFQGEVIIDIIIANDTNNIVLHARQLTISNVAIANPSSGDSEELSHCYELEGEFLILTRKTNEQFAAESKWKLTIIYSGELRSDKSGFYLSKYKDDAGNNHYSAATYFEKTGARHAFPCYDEPGKRANFTITINHSPSYTAISNMPINKVLSSAGKTVFLTTAHIPTYIVGFVISDFEYSEIISNGLVHRIYSRPEKKYGHIWALASSVLIVKYLTEYFGTEFMLPKIDYVEVPDFPGVSMENWGLAIYKGGKLINNNKHFTRFLHDNFELIATALYQHWFGDYVPFKWWTDLWVKQGMTTLFGYRAMDHFYPEWDNWIRFHTDVYQPALSNDGGDTINSYVQKPTEMHGVSKYNLRSSSVLHMWINALTEKVFQKGFHNFLTKHKYNTFENEQLFSAIQTAAEEENCKIPSTISTMFKTWICQCGYPILTVTRNYDNGTFTIKQEDETLKDTKTWYVPINYAVTSDSDFQDTKATHYLLNVIETTFDDVNISKKDWLILNKQSTGYYRINYDADNWNLIAEDLIESPFKFHYRNRAQLIDDAFFFCESNRMDPSIFLKLLSYLKQEDQYPPWFTAYNIFIKFEKYFRNDLMIWDDFKFFVTELVRPMYRKLGVNRISNEGLKDQYTRSSVIFVACRYGLPECLEETSIKLKNHLFENISREPYLEWGVYSGALMQTNDELFNRVYQEFLDSSDEDVREVLFFSLLQTTNETQIEKLMHSSIDESITLRHHERCSILNRLYAKSEANLYACIEFLNQNWDAYGNLNYLSSDILHMAEYVVNKNQEEKLLDLLAIVNNSQHVTSALETDVKKKIADNFEWLEKYGEPMTAWLSQYSIDNGGKQIGILERLAKVFLSFFWGLI